MDTRGELWIDPAHLDEGTSRELEIVIPYTEWALTKTLLRKAGELTAGLNARVTLVAVHTIPYPLTFACPTAAHACLVEQLIDLAEHCDFPVQPHVVLARGREEGFLYVLPEEAIVMVGSRKRPWRTSEEKLARSLVRYGHKVILVHLEEVD